jgi:hypothetical protein
MLDNFVMSMWVGLLVTDRMATILERNACGPRDTKWGKTIAVKDDSCIDIFIIDISNFTKVD